MSNPSGLFDIWKLSSHQIYPVHMSNIFNMFLYFADTFSFSSFHVADLHNVQVSLCISWIFSKLFRLLQLH